RAGGVRRRRRPAVRATTREGGVVRRTLPGRERVDRSVRDSLPRVPGPEGPRLRRRSPRGTRRFPGVPARGRSEEDAEQVLGARAERARRVRSGGTPRASRGSGRGPEDAPARLRTAPASIRGSDGPRRDLEDRLQVRLPLPRLRGRPGDPPCEVPRPRGPERPPRGVAGNQPSGPTCARSEETDPLR